MPARTRCATSRPEACAAQPAQNSPGSMPFVYCAPVFRVLRGARECSAAATKRAEPERFDWPWSGSARYRLASDSMLGRLVGPRGVAERDEQTIPAVDRHHGHRQLDQLGLAEVLARLRMNLVRDMAVGDVRDRFAPGERGALAIGVVRRLAPRVEPVQPLLALAEL